MELQIIFVFLLFTTTLCSNFPYNKSVKTPFTSCEQLTNFLESPCFFDTYLSIINAQNITYEPEINTTFHYPQKLSYKFLPKIPNIPSFLLSKMNVNHTWNKKNLTMNGLIETNYANFNLSIVPNETNKEIFMNINGTIEKKKLYIPNGAVNIIMDQFCDIFLYIVNK